MEKPRLFAAALGKPAGDLGPRPPPVKRR